MTGQREVCISVVAQYNEHYLTGGGSYIRYTITSFIIHGLWFMSRYMRTECVILLQLFNYWCVYTAALCYRSAHTIRHVTLIKRRCVDVVKLMQVYR